MARFNDYTPNGVIPAALLAFDDDFSIHETETRRHLSTSPTSRASPP